MNQIQSEFVSQFFRLMNYPLVKLGDGELTLGGVVKLVLLLVLIFVVEKYLRRVITRRFLSRTHLEISLQYAISRFVGYCFIALGFMVALKFVGLDLSSLAVVAGAIGIGVGFGLQNIVNNFVSGLIILAERPIAIGHRVEVAGVTGQVTKINLRSTTVVTNDNIAVLVPNSDFISRPVTNWSYGDPKVRLRLPVGVAYGTDMENVRRVLMEVAADNNSVLKEPPPSVRFLGFGGSALNLELVVWTIDRAQHPTGFRSDLYFAMEARLRENKIEIPFPQRDLHLRSGTGIISRSQPAD